MPARRRTGGGKRLQSGRSSRSGPIPTVHPIRATSSGRGLFLVFLKTGEEARQSSAGRLRILFGGGERRRGGTPCDGTTRRCDPRPAGGRPSRPRGRVRSTRTATRRVRGGGTRAPESRPGQGR